MRANATFTDPATGRTRYAFAVSGVDTRHGEDPAAPRRTAITADDLHHRVPADAVAFLPEPVDVPAARPTLAYVVREAYETTRGYETASWYDRLTVQPGTYPVRWTDIGHHDVPADADAYYGVVQVDAVVTHTHTENRLMSEVRANDDYPNRPITHTLAPYAYECRPGPYASGELVVVEPAAGEVYPDGPAGDQVDTAPAGFASWGELAAHIGAGDPNA